MAVKYDPNKDYSAAIEQAKASGAPQSTINQLTAERNAKIADKFGGKEPTMYGSNQTYSQATSGGNTGAIKNAVNTYNQYSSTSTTDPWAGTNFHQDAINAAQVGDWNAVIDYLSQREDKVVAQGDNRGKTSAEIYAELWEMYGQQPEIPMGGGGFSYDVSKPTFNSSYNDKIDALLNQILNREDFSYTAADDPLYQQYQSMYNREGTRAMNDTLAAAAANAGGMNSYAITAAQQANNYYATQLGDKIPELYQLAYEMYLKDIDNQVRDLGLLQDMDDTQYGRYRDTMSDWYNDRDFAYGQYRDDVADGQWRESFDYGVSQDAIDNAFRQDQFDWTVSTDNRDYNYQVGRDTVGDKHYDDQWEHQLELDALAKEQQKFENDMLLKELAAAYGNGGTPAGSSSGSGSGSGGGSGGSNGGSDDAPKKTGSDYAGNEGLSEDKIIKMQAAVGADQDGKWGPDSKSKAQGMSATEAWEAYQAGTLAPNTDNYELSNVNGDGWVHVPGYGRMTWTEVYNYVESGKIAEKFDHAKGTITYLKAR